VLWSRIDECGIALLIGDYKVVAAVSDDAIAVMSGEGAELTFCRQRRRSVGKHHPPAREPLRTN
jgi:hypothetical protein